MSGATETKMRIPLKLRVPAGGEVRVDREHTDEASPRCGRHGIGASCGVREQTGLPGRSSRPKNAYRVGPASPSATPWQAAFSPDGRERSLVEPIGIEPTTS